MGKVVTSWKLHTLRINLFSCSCSCWLSFVDLIKWYTIHRQQKKEFRSEISPISSFFPLPVSRNNLVEKLLGITLCQNGWRDFCQQLLCIGKVPLYSLRLFFSCSLHGTCWYTLRCNSKHFVLRQKVYLLRCCTWELWHITFHKSQKNSWSIDGQNWAKKKPTNKQTNKKKQSPFTEVKYGNNTFPGFICQWPFSANPCSAQITYLLAYLRNWLLDSTYCPDLCEYVPSFIMLILLILLNCKFFWRRMIKWGKSVVVVKVVCACVCPREFILFSSFTSSFWLTRA